SRRAALDVSYATRSQGALSAVPAVLLGHLEILEEQDCSQEPAAASVAALRGGKDRRREPGLRHSGLRQVERLHDLGRRGSAQGHALPLSAQAGTNPLG